MKKRLLTLAMAITSYFSYAQTNTFPSSGNVGIGTTGPQAKLHIVGPASGGGRLKIETLGAFAGTDEAKIDFQFYTDGVDSPQAQIKAIGTSGYTGDLVLSTMYNGTFPNALREVMRLQGTTGNVGIGTTSPTRKLDILAGSGVTPLATVGPNGYMLIDNTGAGYNYFQANVLQQFQGTSNNPIMTILGTGNVGIGTTTPDAQLAVNGTIHTKEVKVDMNILPDYVFKPNYRLLSLTAVRIYIDKNQHLPGVPSAEQVEKEGLKLGEMNAVLLKKVEELTLYLLEKDKEVSDQKSLNNQQKEINQSQQKEIDELKKQFSTLIKTKP
jgi:hypothetical protein